MQEVMYGGATYRSLAAMCRELGLNYSKVQRRLHRGLSLADAVTGSGQATSPVPLTAAQRGDPAACAVTGVTNPRRGGWVSLGSYRVAGKLGKVLGPLAGDPVALASLRQVLDSL